MLHARKPSVELTFYETGKGTTAVGAAQDRVVGTSRGAPYSNGHFLWNIPWRYEINGKEVVFTHLAAEKEMYFHSPTGKYHLDVRKNGITRTIIEP